MKVETGVSMKWLFSVSKGFLLLVTILALLFPTFLFITDADAGALGVSTSSVSQGTRIRVSVSGPPGDKVDVNWTDENGTPHSGRIVLPSTGRGSIDVDAPSGSTITYTNVSEPGVPGGTGTIVASARFVPPNNTVVTDLALIPGSTATVANQTFTLGGVFTTVATAVDYDSLSPTYGSFGGIIPATAFNVTGQGTAGTIGFELQNDETFALNLLPVWGLNNPPPPGGLSVPFNIILNGVLNFNSLSSPFSITVVGDVMFFDDNIEVISGTLSGDSDFGPIMGLFSSQGQSQLVPEPSSLLLFGVGVLVALGYGLRRRKQAT
ncbi:PEP-CTERM sorting domain-containing protein [Candidatus Poribacteria bacterium]|nr:PEP-CTERM sorting domain-containing protein [Candidatus Poribacteria bacterium]